MCSHGSNKDTLHLRHAEVVYQMPAFRASAIGGSSHIGTLATLHVLLLDR